MVGQIEERGDRGSENVGVEDAGFVAEAGECEGEVGGDGGFAYAAFGGGHRDDFADRGDALFLGEAAFHAGGEAGGRACAWEALNSSLVSLKSSGQ